MSTPDTTQPPEEFLPACPELLVPAGNREKLETAIAYGADAVYLGTTSMNLRAASAGFAARDLPDALRYARAHCVPVYFCLNALPTQQQMQEVTNTLALLANLPDDAPVHALIIADPGVIRLARQFLPHLPIHLSTQANTANAAAAAFWKDAGVSRINIARELSCSEIQPLVKSSPDMQWEVFVHGAMCMALSGRCLLSAYMTQADTHTRKPGMRSANQGQCTQPCRYEYAVQTLAVEEKTRPGKIQWEIAQHTQHTAILAADDLCLIEYIPWFTRLGLHALKIEGRMKSGGYLAQVTDAYATALRNFRTSGRFCPTRSLQELHNTASRPLTTGLFLPGGQRAQYTTSAQPRPVLARVQERVSTDSWRVAIRSKWDTSQNVEILVPGLLRPVLTSGEYALETHTGQRLTTGHSGTELFLHIGHIGHIGRIGRTRHTWRTRQPDIACGLYLREAHPITGC